jgi:hypothetical protein
MPVEAYVPTGLHSSLVLIEPIFALEGVRGQNKEDEEEMISGISADVPPNHQITKPPSQQSPDRQTNIRLK